MVNETDSTQQTPSESEALAQHSRVTQQGMAEIEALLATARSKLADVEGIHASMSESRETATTRLTEIQTVATAAVVAKTQITDEQLVLAAKSAQIQAAQEHADKVRAELDRIQTAIAQQATEAEGLRARAQTATDNAAEVLSAIRGQKTSADTELAVITTARDVAKNAAAATKDLADRAQTIDERIATYEARLSDLDTQAKVRLETITGLLPGATSAGLAHAFDDRRKTFMKPGTRWQWLFVGSVVALVILALTGLWHVYVTGTPLTWDELARLWIARLPIAGALIWLAVHASRESALAKRLEEDYGYKAAVAASFQGFQKQMADIGSTVAAGSPLSKLCEDTLSTIASPPGRIYEKHQLTVSPSGELTSAASRLMNPSKASDKSP